MMNLKMVTYTLQEKDVWVKNCLRRDKKYAVYKRFRAYREGWRSLYDKP